MIKLFDVEHRSKIGAFRLRKLVTSGMKGYFAPREFPKGFPFRFCNIESLWIILLDQYSFQNTPMCKIPECTQACTYGSDAILLPIIFFSMDYC